VRGRRLPARRLATAALGVGLLAGSWYGLRSQGVQRADVRAGDALRRLSAPAADRAVVATTDFGSLYAVVGASAALGLVGQRRAAADVAGVGTLTWAVAQRSKTFVRRARPYDAEGVRRLIRPPTGSSFPSGHAAVAAAMTALLAERVGRPRIAWGLRGLGAYVAASRVYVGVHYPSDVVGGAGLGLALASLWAGPIAAGGRALVGFALRAARWALLPATVRRRLRGARERPGAGRQAPTRASAAPPRARSAG
jgi:membrane-associated phospholipid phosphatase